MHRIKQLAVLALALAGIQASNHASAAIIQFEDFGYNAAELAAGTFGFRLFTNNLG